MIQMLRRLSAILTAPAVVTAAAAVATAGVFILQTAVDSAKSDLEKLDGLLADRRGELDVVTSLLAQARGAETEAEKIAVLEAVDGAGMYPAQEDLDPLESAERS